MDKRIVLTIENTQLVYDLQSLFQRVSFLINVHTVKLRGKVKAANY